MTNTILFNTMIERYNEKSFSHDYIFGYNLNGLIYVSIVKKSVLPFVLKLDKASRGAGYALRFKPNKEQKMFLMSQNNFVLCSKKFFDESVENSKYNKGEIFENH